MTGQPIVVSAEQPAALDPRAAARAFRLIACGGGVNVVYAEKRGRAAGQGMSGNGQLVAGRGALPEATSTWGCQLRGPSRPGARHPRLSRRDLHLRLIPGR